MSNKMAENRMRSPSRINVPTASLHETERTSDLIDNLNARSRVFHCDDSLVFYFDYSKSSSEAEGQSDLKPLIAEECIDLGLLRKWKKEGRWVVLKHPLVLNFLNQKLLACSLIYTLHVLAFLSFLILLSLYVFEPTAWVRCLLTMLVIVFFLFTLIKATVRARISQTCSLFFAIAVLFNLVTFVATLAYAWAPILFNYDNYHEEIKKLILWFLPILAIVSAWMNLLYILRKSPFGIYIFMMVRILRSFVHIATIWIPTLIAFSFAFHLIMKDSGVEPWSTTKDDGTTMQVHPIFAILKSFTKTSAMMVGELDANDILTTNQWIPSLLVLVFEIITVILLMNLMISLAVGDVSDLRSSAQDKILKIKTSFVIDSLEMSQLLAASWPDFLGIPLYRQSTNNVLVLLEDNAYFNRNKDLLTEQFRHTDASVPVRGSVDGDDLRKSYEMSFLNKMFVRIQPLRGRPHRISLRDCHMQLVEAADSGIPECQTKTNPQLAEECRRDATPIVEGFFESLCSSYSKWLIGLDWTAYIEL